MERAFLVTGASKRVGHALSMRLAAYIAFLLPDDAGFITCRTMLVEGSAPIGKVPL